MLFGCNTPISSKHVHLALEVSYEKLHGLAEVFSLLNRLQIYLNIEKNVFKSSERLICTGENFGLYTSWEF